MWGHDSATTRGTAASQLPPRAPWHLLSRRPCGPLAVPSSSMRPSRHAAMCGTSYRSRARASPTAPCSVRARPATGRPGPTSMHQHLVLPTCRRKPTPTLTSPHPQDDRPRRRDPRRMASRKKALHPQHAERSTTGCAQGALCITTCSGGACISLQWVRGGQHLQTPGDRPTSAASSAVARARGGDEGSRGATTSRPRRR